MNKSVKPIVIYNNTAEDEEYLDFSASSTIKLIHLLINARLNIHIADIVNSYAALHFNSTKYPLLKTIFKDIDHSCFCQGVVGIVASYIGLQCPPIESSQMFTIPVPEISPQVVQLSGSIASIDYGSGYFVISIGINGVVHVLDGSGRLQTTLCIPCRSWDIAIVDEHRFITYLCSIVYLWSWSEDGSCTRVAEFANWGVDGVENYIYKVCVISGANGCQYVAVASEEWDIPIYNLNTADDEDLKNTNENEFKPVHIIDMWQEGGDYQPKIVSVVVYNANRRLLSVSDDGELNIFDVEKAGTCTKRRTLVRLKCKIANAAILPDQKTAVTFGPSGLICVVDLDSENFVFRVIDTRITAIDNIQHGWYIEALSNSHVIVHTYGVCQLWDIDTKCVQIIPTEFPNVQCVGLGRSREFIMVDGLKMKRIKY